MIIMHAEADSATEPKGLDPNDVKGGTSPDKPVQLHNFQAVDHTGSDFTLEQVKVGRTPTFALCMQQSSMSMHPLPMPCLPFDEVASCPVQGDFAMLIFGVTRDFDDAKERLENLSEVVRQSGRPKEHHGMLAILSCCRTPQYAL